MLHGAVLLGYSMEGTNFSGADLTASLFKKSDMVQEQLNGAVIAPSLVEIGGTIFDILHQHSIWVHILGAEGAQADMSGVDLSGVSLLGVELSAVKMERATLTGVNMAGCSLSMAQLAGALMNRSNLANSDFRGAQLPGANLAVPI